MDSGTPAFSVHATCVSFLTALDVASAFIEARQYNTVLIASAEATSAGVDPFDFHTAGLFGDAAAAVVVGRDARSRIHARRVATYSSGKELAAVRGGGTTRPPYPRDPAADHRQRVGEYADAHFQMDGKGLLGFSAPLLPREVEALWPGLSTGLAGFDWVVPHQASGASLDTLQTLGWPRERILRSLDTCGNCVAASIPLTLHRGITSGDIKRGDMVLLCGMAAGVTFAGIVLTY